MKRERFVWFGVILLVILIQLYSSRGRSYDAYEEDMYYELMKEAVEYIRNSYVDESKVEYKSLIYGAMKGMLQSLEDEHSMFLSDSEFKDLNESLSNKFGGLGIYISVRDNYPTVIAPIEGTPAFYSGIESLDKIVEINSKPTKGMKIEEAVKLLKGKPGTTVSIKISREEALDIIPMTITRAIINVPTVKHGVVKEGLAYLRIISFGKQTTDSVKRALEDLKKSNMKKLILDLRNNPGGFLKSAIEIADMFIDSGKIVYTKGRSSQNNQEFYASKANTLLDNDIPIVILVNQGSASASEIVAGCLQDNNRGILLGDKTFGKASIQNIIPLASSQRKAAIRITVQKYFTPLGRAIHKKGIEPNILVKIPKRTFEELYMAKKISDGKYIPSFVKKHYKGSIYTTKALDQFISLLKRKGIIVKKELLEKYIRDEKYKKQIRLFDLNYDIQLKKAILLIEESNNYKKLLVKGAVKGATK